MSVLERRRLRYSVLVIAAACALLSACSDSTQPAAPVVYQTPLPPSAGSPVFPQPTHSGRIYAAAPSMDELYTKFLGVSTNSRYVLYDDSTFALEFVNGRYGAFAYAGRFTRDDSRITFTWEGWSTAGPWGAEGTLRGDSLSVSYNLVMQMTDFIDGTYRRQE
jgi:hypothetical protein